MIRGHVILVHYPDGPRELSTLHIFLNFSDQWAHTPVTRWRYPRLVHDLFEERLVQYPLFYALRVQVSPTQLSPNQRHWDEVHRALVKFGADLT
jgi:hypothetical protein